MPFTQYTSNENGSYTFTDPDSGRQLTAAGPAAEEHARGIDAQRGASLAGPVDPATADLVASQRADLDAQKLAQNSSGDGGMSGMSVPNASVAEPVMTPAPPQTFTPAPPPPEPVMSVAPMVSSTTLPPGGSEPAGPPQEERRLVGAGSEQQAAQRPTDPDAQLEADLRMQAAQQALRGSAGYRVKGGTFETGRSVTQQDGLSDETVQNLGAAAEQGAEAKRATERAQDQGEADAQRDIAAANDVYATRERAWRAESDSQMAELKAKADAITTDIVDTAVKRRSYGELFAEKSVGGKILAGIGFLLGAMGNPGTILAQMGNDIERDLQDQRARLDERKGKVTAVQNLMRETEKITGDRIVANNAAKMAVYESIAAKSKYLALSSNSPAALAKDAEVQAWVAQEKTRLQAENELRISRNIQTNYVTTQDRVVGGSAPSYAKAAEQVRLAREAKASGQATTGQPYSPVVASDADGKVITLDVTADPQKFRERAGAVRNGKRALDEYNAMTWTERNVTQSERASGLRAAIVRAVNLASGNGATTDGELAYHEKLAGGWTGIGSDGWAKGMGSSLNNAGDTLNAGYGRQVQNDRHAKGK